MDNIENIYSLSPLQQGLLFHSVYEPTSRVYQQQLSLRIEGTLDTIAFAAAWRQMMTRHTVLRTAILWEDLDDAYQVVLGDLPLPLTELDWRGHSDQDTALCTLEIAQRQEALDLSAPPLMRLCLVRLADQRWQFIWTHHHIVLDGWSEGIVLRDWLACYHALRQQQTPQLSQTFQLPPTRPFQDYIAWLGEQDVTAAEAYWRSRLGAITEPTPLPSFSPKLPLVDALPHPELCYAEQSLTLSRDVSQRLVAFSRAQHVTLNTVIQAAWGRLLGAYAGRQQALFGVTLGGRPDTLANVEEMVGLFINTLPLVVNWEQNLTVGDWLRQLQAQVAEMRQYEYSALHRLKAMSGLPADRPLFEAILVFENFPLDESLSEAALGDESAELRFSANDGLTRVGDILLSQGRNNFPLSLIAIPSGEAFEFALGYTRQRFEDEQIRCMLRHFNALLDALTQDAQAPVNSLHGLPNEERRQLLAWGTGLPLPTPKLGLHQLFEQHADVHPLQIALVTRTETLRYGELDARANQLARELLDLGVQPNQVVALGLERTADVIVALLAVLKTGAAYLPLDLKQPPARLAELLSDSGAPLVISHSQWRRQFSRSTTPLLELDQIQESINRQSPERVGIDVPLDAAAYLIYTSGSTGAPKGVVIEHQAIVDYLQGLMAALQLPVGCRFGMVSTLAADLGHTQLFGALAGGGTLILADEDTAFDPLALAAFMVNASTDVLKLTPSHLRGVLTANADPALLPNHTLILGGEALDAELVNRVRTLKPGLRIVNHYGPTETTVGAVYHVLPEGIPHTAIVLGRPLPNRRLYVLDEQGRLASTGAPGELYIGGTALAREYLNQPAMTEERFLPDTFADSLAEMPQRMYRTGDRVRWLTDGTLEFLGRVDNQVKIRGYRIELGEVEALVQKLSPAIRQVVARLQQLPEQPPRLIAYVVADGALSTDKLRDDLLLRAPDYLVPSAFILLDDIPLNANGKPDYRRLPSPDPVKPSAQCYTAPRNAVERQLAEIWQAVLKVEPIGIQDNFFSLGGDSILNLQIIARAGQLGYKLTPKQVFERRTIAELAAVLGADADAAPAQSTPQAKSLPLSAGQRARLDAGPLTPTWRCVALAEPIDLAVLTQALQALQQHHRALQIGLVAEGDGAWFQSLPATLKPLTARRLSLSVGLVPAGSDTCPAAASAAEIAFSNHTAELAALAERCLTDLALDQGETLHACLLESDGQHALLILAHPLAVDEPSWPLLLRDLNLALTQLRYRRPVSLPPTGGDWAAWTQHQHAYAQSDALEPSWEHWLQFAGMPMPRLELPPTALNQINHLQLGKQASQGLMQLHQSAHAPWEALLATALASLLDETLIDTPLLLGLQTGRPGLAQLAVDAPIALADFDPSQMVGALAHDTPLVLHWDRTASQLVQLQQTAAQLAAQPQWGTDYAVLRYLSDNPYLLESLTELPAPQFGIRWLGDWDQHQEERAPLQSIIAAGTQPPSTDALQIDAYWHKGHLCLDCHGALAEQWSARLQQRLEDLAALAVDPPAHNTPLPGAFPLCAAQTLEHAELSLDWATIEDLYPLSPMQQGMLLHTQLAPQSGMYLMQERFRWEGPLQRPALEKSWKALFERHPILRTGFLWEHGATPLQYVYRHVDTGLQWFDWRALDADGREQQLEHMLASERHEGFDLRHPPLMRLRVFQLGEQDYLLTRSFHHLLSDAWSFNLVLQELLAQYKSECRQEPAARPVGRPFRDYLRWLMRQDLQAAETFWKAELAGFEEPTPLVVEQRTEQGTPEAVADLQINLSVARTQQLQTLCQQHQLTANTWLQGAWSLLLSRYSGKRDVVFGVTVAGRPAELRGVDGIAGVFINSLPLRVKIDDGEPVAAWLTQLFARNIALRDYEHTPLAEIQRWSEVEPGRALFDSLLIYENAPQESTENAQAQDFSIDLLDDRGLTNYPLSLMVMPGSRLGLRLSYDRTRFTEKAIARMLGHLRQLLEDMLDRPEAPIGTLNLLTPPERQQILVDWNQSAANFPLDQTYAALFAQRVAEHPERIAAVCGNASLTYGELDQRANRIAHTLIAVGATPNTLVALLAERGLPLLTMMIAVFKAGAAYQPLDIHHPPRRLGELLNQSGAPLLLVSEGSTALLETALAQLESPPVCLITEQLWLTGVAHQPPQVSTPQDLAYVIFTSGSTGTPKGAMVEQRGMLNNMFGNQLSIGLCANDKVAQVASPAFDISVWQFLAAPLVGATVHILPDEVTMDPVALLRAVDEQGITLMELVPTQIRSLLGVAGADATLRSLRWLQSIGEALPPGLVRDWLRRFPTVPLLNAYGPAECSDNIAYHPVTDLPVDIHRPIPIGGPTANNQLYILDDAQRPVPVGVPGEICAAGVSVGRGYWHDPERTAEVFGDHPFVPGQRFYRTGDIGRWREDGIIEYLGRRDFQFKLRGLRIELGEIEARLEALPGVASAAVVATVTEDGSQHLIAYWSGTEERPDAEFRRLLNEQLPGYMTPSLFVRLDSLPQNRNGKVDRNALSQRAVTFGPRDSLAPRSNTEQQLAAIWAELLPTRTFGIDDNFFSLGGHSLLATQVISRVRAAFKVALPLRALFDHPTVAALAQRIDTARNQASCSPSCPPPITPQPRDGRLPLSFAQQRLWFLEQLSPTSNLFTMPFALTLTGELDVTALQQSFAFLLERHEILRTAFEAVDGEPWQQIHASTGFDLPITDLSAQPDEASAIIHQQLSELSRSFDLRRPPLLRAQLFRCVPQRHVLLLALHHIVIDDWSLGLLVDDLMCAYQAFSKGEPPQLMPLALQYADFAAWQRQYVSGELRQRQLDYWRQQLAGSATLLDLPGRLNDENAAGSPLAKTLQDRPLQAKPPQGGRHRQLLPSALTQALQKQADAASSSLFMVLHAALSVLLHQQTGRIDLLIGTDIANRHHHETETMLGFFVNQLVLRCRLQPEQQFGDVLAHCRDTTLAAYQHQDLPFDALVAELLPQRHAGRSPFFQIKLILQNAPQKDLHLEGLQLEEWEQDIREAEFELSINAIPTADGLQLLYNFRPNRYPRQYIERFSALFETLLSHLADASDTTISGLVQILDQRQQLWQQQLQEQQQQTLDSARSARDQQRASLSTARRRSVTIEPLERV